MSTTCNVFKETVEYRSSLSIMKASWWRRSKNVSNAVYQPNILTNLVAWFWLFQAFWRRRNSRSISKALNQICVQGISNPAMKPGEAALLAEWIDLVLSESSTFSWGGPAVADGQHTFMKINNKKMVLLKDRTLQFHRQRNGRNQTEPRFCVQEEGPLVLWPQ